MKVAILSELRLYACNNIVAHVPSHHLRLWFYREIMRFDLAEGSSILMATVFDCAGNFRMGENSVINARCRIDNRGGVSIGQNVAVSSDTIILTADHDPNSSEFSGRCRSVTLEDFAWVGTGAMILPGVTVRRGGVVAAGAVATREVKPYRIAAGVPAREIADRCSELNYTTNYRRLFQ